jgi:hypothetical protein
MNIDHSGRENDQVKSAPAMQILFPEPPCLVRSLERFAKDVDVLFAEVEPVAFAGDQRVEPEDLAGDAGDRGFLPDVLEGPPDLGGGLLRCGLHDQIFAPLRNTSKGDRPGKGDAWAMVPLNDRVAQLTAERPHVSVVTCPSLRVLADASSTRCSIRVVSLAAVGRGPLCLSPQSVTDPAYTSKASGPDVVSNQVVPCWTYSLGRLNRLGCLEPAAHVFLMRDRLQMVWIHATVDPASMVQFRLAWDRAAKSLVNGDVGLPPTTIDRDSSIVARAGFAGPEPATAVRLG